MARSRRTLLVRRDDICLHEFVHGYKLHVPSKHERHPNDFHSHGHDADDNLGPEPAA